MKKYTASYVKGAVSLCDSLKGALRISKSGNSFIPSFIIRKYCKWVIHKTAINLIINNLKEMAQPPYKDQNNLEN